MSLFDTTPLGRHSSRMGKDVDSIDNRLNDSLRMVLATLAQIVASIVMVAIVCELPSISADFCSFLIADLVSYLTDPIFLGKACSSTSRTAFANASLCISSRRCDHVPHLLDKSILSRKCEVHQATRQYFEKFPLCLVLVRGSVSASPDRLADSTLTVRV